jgi:hypothetical protein
MSHTSADRYFSEFAFGEELVVRSAQDSQILERVGAALCPCNLVIEFEKGRRAATFPVGRDVTTAKAIASDNLPSHFVRDVASFSVSSPVF